MNVKEAIVLIKEKLNIPLSEKEIEDIINCPVYSYIWEKLLKNKLEHNYNFILTIKFAIKYFDFSEEYSDFEKKIYNNLEKSEILFLMSKNLEKILSSSFNEMIKKDIDIVGCSKTWVAINLDCFYFINLDHMHNFYNKIITKKNTELSIKILDINIIINTIERIRNVYFYTKLKKNDYPKEITESINFTKGYLICFNPEIVSVLKNYKYLRKLIQRKAKKIIIKKKNINFLDASDNNNFSQPIWINDNTFKLIDFENSNIFNKELLYEKSNIELWVAALNFLNSIELRYDKITLETIINIINNNTSIDKTLSSRSQLENYVLKINNKDESEFTEITSNLTTLIQSASVLDLIEKQIKYYSSFFLDHRIDSRMRIYCYPWPVNYQLNHIIRNSIIINNNNNILNVWNKFLNHKSIKKYIKNENIFEFNENHEILKIINNIFTKWKLNSKTIIEENLKKEYLYQLLIKISNKSKGALIDRIKFSFEILDNFLESNMNDDWGKWIDVFKFKKKNLPYLISYHRSLIQLKKNITNQIFWCDASSNAIQLMILRLNIKDNFLLKLVNIYDNDTNYSNIYEYVTEEIKNKNHDEILKKIKNKITSNDLNKLQEIDNNKYLLMPSVYGMGKFTYRSRLNKMLISDDRKTIWDKLNEKDKNKISDYFWNCAEEILLKINFNIVEYKKICTDFWKNEKYEAFLWKNDLNVTIGPVSVKKSNRDLLLKKLNILKLKKKEASGEEVEKLEIETKEKNKKLEKNDKDFWKRTMVKTKKRQIFCRIYYKKKYKIDERLTRQSLVANTIHSYDASVLALSILICKHIGIKVLVIHDSMGANALCMPLVKIIFKISNIIILEKNSNKTIFPIKKKKNIEKHELELLFKNIIKSKNFFK